MECHKLGCQCTECRGPTDTSALEAVGNSLELQQSPQAASEAVSAEFNCSVECFIDSKGGGTVKQLSQELDVHVDRVRAALLNLEKKGLVQVGKI